MYRCVTALLALGLLIRIKGISEPLLIVAAGSVGIVATLVSA